MMWTGQGNPRSRRGITLTEILISILLMGIGFTSLMTLFPLGLLRVREAARYSRSGFLTESATADLGVRNLLSKASFQNRFTGIWYADTTATYTPWPYDPWLQDTPSYLGDPIRGPQFGAYRGNGSFNIHNASPHDLDKPTGFIAGQGLPVAYDPLWRDTTGVYLGSTVTEARFGSGIGYVRTDPDGGQPSAHGLQRITNFPAGIANVPDIFVSPDDVVLQSDADKSAGAGAISPIVPDLGDPTNPNRPQLNPVTKLSNPQNDWKYSWMFTGQQADCSNGTVFTGDIVIFENRPFAVDTVTAPLSTTVTTAIAGETVVEAIFGYTSNVTVGVGSTASKVGYGSKANHAVLLRWTEKRPDPEIRVGNWFADVTYERNAATDFTRSVVDPSDPAQLASGVGPAGNFYPYQRCYWYQIAKRTEASPSATLAGYREMVVWTSTPLKALTLLNSNTGATNGTPYHCNAALISPYVVNVYQRTIYTR